LLQLLYRIPDVPQPTEPPNNGHSQGPPPADQPGGAARMARPEAPQRTWLSYRATRHARRFARDVPPFMV
jgi:hypothetical protein